MFRPPNLPGSCPEAGENLPGQSGVCDRVADVCMSYLLACLGCKFVAYSSYLVFESYYLVCLDVQHRFYRAIISFYPAIFVSFDGLNVSIVKG